MLMTGVVHTKSDKFPINAPSVSINQLVSILQAQEDDFYNSLFGGHGGIEPSTIKDLINAVRSLGEIRDYLKNFTADNLNKIFWTVLQRTKIPIGDQEQQVRLQLTINNPDTTAINKMLEQINGITWGNGAFCTATLSLNSSDKIDIAIKPKLGELQDSLAQFKDLFKITSGRQYKNTSANTLNLRNYLRQLNQDELFTVTQGSTDISQYTINFVTRANFKASGTPFNLTKQELEFLGRDKTDAELHDMVCNNQTFLYDYFATLFDGNMEMITAMSQVWPLYENRDFTNFSTFMQGGLNAWNCFLGDAGELEGALIMQLLANRGIVNPMKVQIWGNKTELEGVLKGKKSPIDILMTLGKLVFGIQSKDYSELSSMYSPTYTTKLNSGEIPFSDEERTAIVNLYFNSSYGDPQSQAAAFAKQYGPELLRLARSQNNLDGVKRNTLFLINARYLVPGSVILRMHLEDLVVNGPSARGSDDDFAAESDEKGRPVFVDYWKHPPGVWQGKWIVNHENLPTYNEYANSISFTISFELSMAQNELSEYDIFG